MVEPDLPPFARFIYPEGIGVRDQPPVIQGSIHLVEVPRGDREGWTGGSEPDRPMRHYVMALAEFAPEERLMRMLFQDVDDQIAFEQANLGRDEKFLLKSPEGGVWRMRVEQRLYARARRDGGTYAIEAGYRLGDIETLSSPRASAR